VEEKLVQRSAELGEYLLAQLSGLRHPDIQQVRGRGLWVGIELKVKARPACEALKELGVLCKETHDKVIRVAPPLVITREEIDWALERFRQVMHRP
jgi:ornithine--oxo-acid transaminase